MSDKDNKNGTPNEFDHLCKGSNCTSGKCGQPPIKNKD